MLEKKYRLRQSKDYQAVYQNQNAVAVGSIVLYIRGNNGYGLPRVGLSLSKKLGNAVARNRMRRIIREAVRKHIGEIEPANDYVFVGRRSLAKASLQRVEADVVRALARKDCIITGSDGERQG